MKTITSSLMKFTFIAIALTILFRYFLSKGIESRSDITIFIAVALYVIGMFIAGWLLGKKEGTYLPVYDVGFRFHLATFLAVNLVSELWFILGFNSGLEKIGVVHAVLALWGGVLLLHFTMYLKERKKAISNLRREDIFE